MAALTFDDMVTLFHERLDRLPDRRTGKNTQYSVKDAALGGFSVFFTQSASFLAHQRAMKEAKGRSNAETLFRIRQIPSDNQIRSLLDPIKPDELYPVYAAIGAALDQTGQLDQFRVLDGQLLVTLDGTYYFSSKVIHCPNCSERTVAGGETLYYHSAITPVVVAPGLPQVVSLEPEFIVPQDGHEKQDCERAAAKRWMERYAAHANPHQITLLGDDLYSNQPMCQSVLEAGFNFIFVCKPESHPILYEWLDYLAANHDIDELDVHHWNGRFTEIAHYRYASDLPLRAGDDALIVDWCEISVTRGETGEVLYHNAFVTNHRLTEQSVVPIARAGRARWKIENENNNVLKTKGYHVEHNFGHGSQYLASFLLTLNLLAFLFHTVLELTDAKYRLLRQELAARQTFFNDVRTLTRYFCFDSWQHLLDFMITQLELQPKLDTS